jgi:hypothetical protein
MPLDLHEEADGRVLAVRLTGKLEKADYETFAPKVDQLVEQHGSIRILVEMHDFHGWTAGATWEDIKVALKHYRDIERIALVGETKWQQGMATFCKPFTKAEVKFFELGDAVQARTWILEGVTRIETATEPESSGPAPSER